MYERRNGKQRLCLINGEVLENTPNIQKVEVSEEIHGNVFIYISNLL
jgi:hypothetical protein